MMYDVIILLKQDYLLELIKRCELEYEKKKVLHIGLRQRARVTNFDVHFRINRVIVLFTSGKRVLRLPPQKKIIRPKKCTCFLPQNLPSSPIPLVFRYVAKLIVNPILGRKWARIYFSKTADGPTDPKLG